ncbi:MAG: inner membrane-spanning protein YciB [Paracoccaceae bacterium]
MAEQKHINPTLKLALELGPVILFFIAYTRLRDRSFVFGGEEYSGFVVVTAAFIPLIALSTFALWRLTGKLSVMQLMTLILVTIFGGLSVWLNDERFFKMKPTIIYLIFGGILGFGLLRGKGYLRHVMEGMMPLTETGWTLLTKRFMAFFFGLALANEIIWRSFSTDVWVNFKTFGLPLVMIMFVMSQSRLMARHADVNVKDDGRP